ncbi:MAG: inositol-3-phosphate synthase [Pirellulaceae bacterium]|nr:inositol-3-phosphate synthase [Planctomycetales bacterium]
MPQDPIGVWLIGAHGGVGTTSVVGLAALQRGLVDSTALVSALPQFSRLALPNWQQFVVGGHDIRATSFAESAENLLQVSHVLDAGHLQKCSRELAKWDKNIQRGTLQNVGKTIESLADPALLETRESPRDTITRIQSDLQSFVSLHRLRQLVVINVASTEPPFDVATLPTSWSELNKQLGQPRKCKLPASSLYAIAALELGFPYINFTPSLGSAPAAICELARQRGTCHMGHDGKTGETLLKSVLAPMFAARHLEVMSWVGHNIFGNLDGKVLDDPLNKKTKVTSKDSLLGQILGYHPQTLVSIEYIQSLGDWKTAWDHIHFRGFLGTPMTMQFTWQGCDSLLAAPLVLDLLRFTCLAQQQGEQGLLTFLASFFKSPLGVKENNFAKQFAMLEAWAEKT